MRTSMFAFATDAQDEGIDVVLGRLSERAGVSGVTLAAVYHHGRDIFPHNPVRRVRFLEGGTAFFRPEPARYAATELKPAESRLAADWDAFTELRAATRARGMELHAWTVVAHNSRLGAQHPTAAVQNVFGDPQITSLCPANPAVVEYARALTGDIARYEVDSLLVESLHFHPLEHGYHHERYLIGIGPIDRFLLGLCFCPHCGTAGQRDGVDVEALADAVRERLERLFASARAYDGTEDTREVVVDLWDGELDAFLRARERTVARAALAVAEGLRSTGTRLAFMDQAGGMKGYADGLPTGGPAPEVSWKIGVDVQQVAEACDEIQVLAYARDPHRVATDLAAYRSLLGDRCDLRVALRPIPPDCDDAGNLTAKLAVARQAGVQQLDLYHYGFARLETLDLIRGAQEQNP
jgi:hypothetical protein